MFCQLPLGMSGDVRLLLNGEWEFAEGPDGDPPTDGWGARARAASLARV